MAGNKSEGGANPHPWEELLEKIGAPKKNEFNIRGVYSARDRFINNPTEEENEILMGELNGIKTLIKKEVGPEDPIIRGPIEIAKGEKLILGIAPDQDDAFAIIYGLDTEDEISYYATVERTRGKSKIVKDVLVKYCDVLHVSTDHLIISEGLARELKVRENQIIRVLSIYQKTSDINLDKL
jgi:hypothetical protein